MRPLVAELGSQDDGLASAHCGPAGPNAQVKVGAGRYALLLSHCGPPQQKAAQEKIGCERLHQLARLSAHVRTPTPGGASPCRWDPGTGRSEAVVQ